MWSKELYILVATPVLLRSEPVCTDNYLYCAGKNWCLCYWLPMCKCITWLLTYLPTCTCVYWMPKHNMYIVWTLSRQYEVLPTAVLVGSSSRGDAARSAPPSSGPRRRTLDPTKLRASTRSTEDLADGAGGSRVRKSYAPNFSSRRPGAANRLPTIKWVAAFLSTQPE